MGFIKFHNVFMDNGEYKLTPLDWEYYSLVASCWSPFNNTSRISIAHLAEIQSHYNNQVESIKRKKVKDKVWSLNSRGIFNILTPENEWYVDLGSKQQFNYNKTLEIFLNEFAGYEEITNDIHNLSTDVNERFAINCIYRFHMLYIVEKKIHRGFTKSLKEWENLLSCSENTAKDTIERLLKRNIIIREGWNRTQLESGQYKSTPYEYFMNVEVLNGNQSVIEYVKHDKVDEIEKVKEQIEIVVVETFPEREKGEIDYGNWKGGNNLTPDDYILYAKQEDNEEFMKVAESKIMRISANRTKDKTVYAIEKAIEIGRDTVNEVEFREQAARNSKIKSDNVSLIRNCKGIPIVKDDFVHDMLIDDIDNLTLSDKIYWLEDQEQTEHGYRIGTKTEISECNVSSLVKGESDDDYGCEFIKFNKTNIDFLFSEFKRIIREIGCIDNNTLKQLTKIRNNLINEQSEGKEDNIDWEGDVWRYDHPNPDPVNVSKQKRFREQTRINRMSEENQRMEQISKSKSEDDSFSLSLFD